MVYMFRSKFTFQRTRKYVLSYLSTSPPPLSEFKVLREGRCLPVLGLVEEAQWDGCRTDCFCKLSQQLNICCLRRSRETSSDGKRDTLGSSPVNTKLSLRMGGKVGVGERWGRGGGGEREGGLCPTKGDLQLGLHVYMQFFICKLNANKPTSEKKKRKKRER